MATEPQTTADDGGTVIKRWVIVHEPGLVPEKKIPHPQTHDGVIAFLRELVACRPAGTRYTVAELTWDHDLWVSSGHEVLAEAALLEKYTRPRRRRKEPANAG